MNLEDYRNSWALVTGASSGIGREFCLQLAPLGVNLVMVARREQQLKELAGELEARHSIRTLVLVKDLSQPSAAGEVRQAVNTVGICPRILINNAGFGRWGRFEATSADVYQQMIQVNVGAVVDFCHTFLPDLVTFPSSVIINVSSGAAYQPVPFMATYAATKAFVHSFSQALYGEWKERGVLVKTLIPGPTATEFDAKAGAYASAIQERGNPSEVVQVALKSLTNDSPLAVAAKGTYKQRFFAGLFPASIVIREVAKMFRPPK
ncbi:SDR family NAD(P)-dependent oxidoreductase [Candidatus Contendibacter odensensis]|uniref:Short-chain dehydrogenase/reductase SDR n=1 Tax=Candidatus Contendobacter odensis Run_B_J11 TaxID=1400861 RepID=A0A7U7GDQ4_9GAMM|nr:SDR family oxidoreductase [Candidatus Contendobacter odensis]CDH46510.1 putative short-chain dehydrogenase/reductase SDR [Candidatus Contendobacter odensis Run_B_J11]